ncbi:MAG: hypothetical protein IT173_18770 [Acidobacteria bacterium]|nr:hypothetical protein [Acidobacteriota bacterium]
MKPVQKLEVAFGLATFASTLAFFCAFIIPLAIFKYENYGYGDAAALLFRNFLILLTPGALTAIGAYLWGVKMRHFGFVIILFGGAVVSILFGLSHFLAAMYYAKGVVEGLLVTMPLVFAIVTVVFAFLCRREFRFGK